MLFAEITGGYFFLGDRDSGIPFKLESRICENLDYGTKSEYFSKSYKNINLLFIHCLTNIAIVGCIATTEIVQPFVQPLQPADRNMSVSTSQH